MLDKLMKLLEKPPVYTKMEHAFWDDDYISEQMLKAHLDPDFEGASRNLRFIEHSAAWIKDILPPSRYPFLLDVGCGPGIYAELFSSAGYRVTGIDFSRRSIGYAKASAERRGLDIRYLCLNYLKMDFEKTFDAATMIYCDYGVLSPADRRSLLRNVYRSLRPGGRFLLDVFSMAAFDRFKEGQTWEVCENGGFWCGSKYAALNGACKYPDGVTLEQTAVISERETAVYYLWNTYFTVETLAAEAAGAGFKVCGRYGDVTGSPCQKDAPTIAVLLERP
ncbi:class I SAM-dependent methyltransferase [[Clostridium] symbiosum]|uniref:class I SAM-dependent methyltransferase n=1 Tax=Clostridium symbiosum TaxID=1512 RepID=UPI001D06C48B|nr:class I SAM-dependent methyltransferase [[Clostridium] symbiosum]MCB6607314.1 class I SAM-dependent methyltransferase [[Clostridium] symbiosum]MCB6929874.1 class I SAM-dependent methyltransferase [[Clostridium] symbiosum]